MPQRPKSSPILLWGAPYFNLTYKIIYPKTPFKVLRPLKQPSVLHKAVGPEQITPVNAKEVFNSCRGLLAGLCCFLE